MKKRLFCFGLIVTIASAIFGVVSLCYAVTVREDGAIVVFPAEKIYRIPARFTVLYPLRNFHFLSYVFSALGLLITYHFRPELKWSVSTNRN